MKVLWITNILFEHHRTMVGLDSTIVTGGSWLNAAYESSLNNPDIQLHIATSGSCKEMLHSECDGNHFYIVPGGGMHKYDIDSKENYNNWKQLRDITQPDVVILWGTECRCSYVALKAMQGIPVAIYMQGVIESIYEHYYEGMPDKYRNSTVRDLLDKFNPNSTYNNFKAQVPLEREMLRMASAVIVENDWCEDMCKAVNPSLIVFRNNLPIRDIYSSKEWSIDNIERKTIFTNAGGYPIKGHHVLFQALALVKKVVPDFKCYVPGERLCSFNGIKRTTGYTKMLNDIIKKYQLQDNIIYTGILNSNEMLEYLVRCNVYVMPSVIENHSSSLIEAMMVGVPSISSLVGGTASLVKHGHNAILYNSLDARSLSGNIIRVFEDDGLAEKLSRNAIMIRGERKDDFGEEMNIILKRLAGI